MGDPLGSIGREEKRGRRFVQPELHVYQALPVETEQSGCLGLRDNALGRGECTANVDWALWQGGLQASSLA